MKAPGRQDGRDRPPKRAPPTARRLPFEILRYSIRSGALLIACLAAALFDLANARRANVDAPLQRLRDGFPGRDLPASGFRAVGTIFLLDCRYDGGDRKSNRLKSR